MKNLENHKKGDHK